MPLSSSNAVRQLSDGNSMGTILGTSSTDVIGFYGITSGVARVAIGGSLSSAGSMAMVSTMVNALVNLGLITVSTLAA